MSGPFKLFRLQQVDTQMDQAHARLSEIEAILREDELLQQVKNTLELADAANTVAEKEVRSAEDKVTAQRIKVEHNQSALYGGGVKDPKELQDLQAEAEALNRQFENLENIQLEKMLLSEETQSVQKEAMADLAKLEGERAIEHGELGIEQDQLREEVGRLNVEREAAGNGIDAKDLASYETLRSSKAGLAVAKVKDKTCTACGTILSESLAQASRSPSELSNCSTCKRILYSG